MPASSAKLIFSISRRAVALRAWAGSREVTSRPSEGPLIYQQPEADDDDQGRAEAGGGKGERRAQELLHRSTPPCV
ncbi:hypothetical protein [Streptomyces sp. NPDC005181]|uniref:hypothetical protein n=1 Tax=Streptomyces sp. NPDC005181 TaxID=3156869 RepID=UPI00339EE152